MARIPHGSLNVQYCKILITGGISTMLPWLHSKSVRYYLASQVRKCKFNSSFKSTDLRLTDIDRLVIVLCRLLEKLTSGKNDYMYVT